jgi:hypothetical protein
MTNAATDWYGSAGAWTKRTLRSKAMAVSLPRGGQAWPDHRFSAHRAARRAGGHALSDQSHPTSWSAGEDHHRWERGECCGHQGIQHGARHSDRLSSGTVQVGRAGPAVPRRLWYNCPALPPTAPPALSPRVPSGNEATIPELAEDHRPGHGRIRAEHRTPLPPFSLVIASRGVHLTTPLQVSRERS